MCPIHSGQFQRAELIRCVSIYPSFGQHGIKYNVLFKFVSDKYHLTHFQYIWLILS